MSVGVSVLCLEVGKSICLLLDQNSPSHLHLVSLEAQGLELRHVELLITLKNIIIRL